MSHINICLNHIKSIGYISHFTDGEEDAKLVSFEILNSEELVELKLVNKKNKSLDRTVTFKFIEDVVDLVVLGTDSQIKQKVDISPNVDRLQSKKSTNVIIDKPAIETEKMEEHNSKILENTKKVNDLMFSQIKELNDSDPDAWPLWIAKTKAVAQASQVIINSAKVEMDYLKRFGNKK